MHLTITALARRAAALLLAPLLLVATPAHAQLRLDITQGVRDALPIAVVPFGGQAEGGPSDVAAVVAGAGSGRIIWRHLLPSAMAPVLVSASFGVAGAILVESSLSFLGFGVPPSTPSWGSMLSQAQQFMDIAWWLTLTPGFAIFATITAYNLVGEAVRDAIDPNLRT